MDDNTLQRSHALSRASGRRAAGAARLRLGAVLVVLQLAGLLLGGVALAADPAAEGPAGSSEAAFQPSPDPVVQQAVVEPPVIEALVAPDPVVEAPVVADTVVEAMVAPAPVVEAPVVEAPVVTAAVADPAPDPLVGAAGAPAPEGTALATQDTLTATAPGSDVQTQVVVAAPQTTTLRLTAPISVSHGQLVTPTAALTGAEGVPLAGLAVVFEMGGQTQQALTDAAGVAQAPSGFTVSAVPPDTVTFTASFAGDQAHTSAMDSVVASVAAGECTLTNTTNPTQSTPGPVQVSATFANVSGSGLLAGHPIVFTAEGTGGPLSATAPTNSDGVASTTLQLPGGASVVTASFAGNGFSPCASQGVIVNPLGTTSLALTPERSATPIGTVQQLTATLTVPAGASAAGVPVTLAATAGPSLGKKLSEPVVTNALGVAVFSVSSTVPGTDVLVASAAPLPATVTSAATVTSGQVTVSWVHAPSPSSTFSASPVTDVTALAQALAGPGVTVTNVAGLGHQSAFGTFTGGAGAVGLSEGVVLSTGSVAAVTPNMNADNHLGTAGDQVLTTLIGRQTFDAAVLSFDFVPVTDEVVFHYVFASREYSVFVNSSFNDVFAFHVNGVNCATVPGSGDAVSVNNINAGAGSPGSPLAEARTNPHLFLDNDGPQRHLTTSLTGMTTVLTCRAKVTPGQINTMRLAIADVADSALDSAVFLQAGSLVAVGRFVLLAPATVTSVVGTTATITASVFENGQPRPGVPVTFTVTNPLGQTLTGTATTGAAGTAVYTWSRADATTDTIVAAAASVGGSSTVQSPPATRVWIAAPPSVTAPAVPVTAPLVPPADPGDPPAAPLPGPVVPPDVPQVLPPAAPLPDLVLTPFPAPEFTPVLPTEVTPVNPVLGPGVRMVDPLLPNLAPPRPIAPTGRTFVVPLVIVPPAPGPGAPLAATAVDRVAASSASSADRDSDVDAGEPPLQLPFAEPPAQDPQTAELLSLDLALDRPSSLPGGVARISGQGCPAGSEVRLSLEGRTLGRTSADDSGAFSAVLEVPQLALGVFDVEARCGNHVQSVPLTLVVAASTGAVGAAAAAVGVLLAFFVLIASFLLLNNSAAPSAVVSAGLEEQDDES